jgi:hypothetical protein
MKAYTVHLRRHEQNHGNDIVLVLEGFCWSAFLLSVLWTLWHRMWWVALGLVSVSLIFNGIIYVLVMETLAAYFLGIGTAVLYGLLANDLRRWSLARVGFKESGVALGDNEDTALARFLDNAPDIAKEIHQ